MFLDTGLRRNEMAELTRGQLVIDDESGAWLKEIDPKSKQVKFSILGEKTTEALTQYLESREDDHPALWMGRWGPLTHEGIYNIVDKRSKQAGVKRAHPHLFRKTFATWWTRNGGDRDRLMKLGGWADEEILEVYVLLDGLDLMEAHRQFGPVDNML